MALLAPLLLGILLFAGMNFALRGERDMAPPAPAMADVATLAPPATQPPVATPTPTVLPTPAPIGVPSPTPTQDALDEIVAVVSGRPIHVNQITLAHEIDRFMATWLQRPFRDDRRATLERLINAALILGADAAPLDAAALQTTQPFLLALLGVSTPDDDRLVETLRANGLEFDQLLAHVAALREVDRRSREQAAAMGLTVPDHLRRLQADARISFGPAAQQEGITAILAAPHAEEPILASKDESPAEATADHEALASSPESAQPAPPPTATPTVLPADQPRGVAVGLMAPALDLPLAGSSEERLTDAQLIGMPTVLSFWTTWCGYCRAQTPVLVAAYERYHTQGIRFVGINVREGRAQVEEYLTQNGVPYPNGLDEDGTASLAYQIRGFPTTYFLDAAGHIQAQHIGQLSPSQVDEYIARLLATP